MRLLPTCPRMRVHLYLIIHGDNLHVLKALLPYRLVLDKDTMHWYFVRSAHPRQPSLISSEKSLRESTSEQSRQSFSLGSMVVV